VDFYQSFKNLEANKGSGISLIRREKNFAVLFTYSLFLITFLISFSLIHTHNLNDSLKNFYTEITHLIKNINYNSVLNREQDSLIKFIPLIFGVYVLGKKCDLNQFNFIIYYIGAY
jgi:hypothetical protein